MPETAPTGSIADDYEVVRDQSLRLCEPLAIEDYGVQPMVDASPPKWHLAHTTWFFETFLLEPFVPGYRVFDPAFGYLFNSYYNGIGTPYPRPERGNLSRPTVAQVKEYRQHVDEAMAPLLHDGQAEIAGRVILGLHHEQQHQELLLTDLKVNLGGNPMRPCYRDDLRQPTAAPPAPPELAYVHEAGGIVETGVDADAVAFCFDNECPRHRTFLEDFRIANRLVTNREYLAFIEDGGYKDPLLWLSEGHAWLQETGARAPMYWHLKDDGWHEYRLCGETPLVLDAPVTHVNFFEADAFARWAGARLPTEAEWEVAAMRQGRRPRYENFVEAECLHPMPAYESAHPAQGQDIAQLYGDCWEWTMSAYGPYPGFQPMSGALGEYNGKFMASQQVLKGGSCATPTDHIRPSYRNFFYPKDRWQFTGIRLVRDDAG